MKTFKQLFFINTPKNALQKRETGYTESKGNSIRFGGTMFKKVLTLLAVVLIGLSVAGPVFAQIIPGYTSKETETFISGTDHLPTQSKCERRCACPDTLSKKGQFYKNMVDYTEENQGACWFCDIFEKLFNTINKVVTYVFNGLGKSFLFLMGWGLLFLILFKVGKMLIQLQEVDVMQFLNDLIKPLGRGIIGVALLLGVTSQSDHIFNMLTSPIFEISAKLGIEIMDVAIPNNVEYIKSGTGKDNDFVYTLNKCDEYDTLTSNGKAFTDGQRDLLVCWLEQISSSFVVGIAIGGTLMDIGTEGKNFFNGGFSMTMVGLIIWGCFYLIYLFFPFKIVDIFIKMALVLTLMPLWIVLWVFPPTVGYTKKAWEMFLSACILMIIISVMISMAVILMSKSIPSEDRKGLLQCLRAGYGNLAVTWVPFGGGAILNTIAFAMLSWTLIGTAEPLANTFIGSGNIGVGNNMANLTARTAGVAWGATKAASKWGLWAGGLALGGARALGRRMGKGRGGSSSSNAAALGHYSSGASGNTSSGFFSRLTPSAQSLISSGINDTISAIQNAFMTSSFIGNKKGIEGNMGPQNILMNAKSPEEREALKQMMENMDKNATGKGANRRPGAPDKKDIERLQEIRAREMIANDPTAEQARQNQERSEKQDAKVTDIETQGKEESQTKDGRQIQQEEAIHKLQQNQDGVRATQDLASNMAFIQNQMTSATTVDELRKRLKGHDWNYSGNSRNEYAHYMNRTAEAMFNAQQSGNTEKMRKEIGSAMRNCLKHGHISYLDDVTDNIVQKSDNLSQVIENLNNLAKKE